MGSAQLGKLQALLKRVEERRAQPRLQALSLPAVSPQASLPAASPQASPPAASSPVSLRETGATVPELARVEPSAARASTPAPLLTPEPFEPITEPPLPPEPARKAPSSSPLESAMALLDAPEPPSAAAPAPDLQLTARPEPLLEQPLELTQPKRTPEREPTIEFETAKVRVHARELRAVGEPMAAPAPLTAPSQTLEAAPLSPAAQPARSVSAVRVEAPKTFGELLDLSLALRPRG